MRECAALLMLLRPLRNDFAPALLAVHLTRSTGAPAERAAAKSLRGLT